jgi:hypothetical protein
MIGTLASLNPNYFGLVGRSRNCTDMQQVDLDDIMGDELVRGEVMALQPLFDLS